MSNSFGADSFFMRWVLAVILVFGTYNPTPFSYVGWLLSEGFSFGPLPALAGVLLLSLWILFLRATFLSMGWLGITLGAAIFATMLWLLIDLGLLSLESTSMLTWLSLVVLSLLLGLGISWSHMRRRLTGQIDVDDVED